MSTVDELLARIIADPFDDDLRGVYADALVDAGDHHGESINCERALAKLGIETIDDLVFSRLEGEAFFDAAALLKRAMSSRGSRNFVRGFETIVRGHRAEDIALAMTRGPIDTLEIDDRSAPLDTLLALPLDRIRTFDATELRIHRYTKRLLAAMPHLASLSISARGGFDVNWLAECPALVELSIDNLDDEQFRRLAALPCAPKLRRLRIGGGSLGALDGFVALERLDLSVLAEQADLSTGRLPRELVIRASRLGPRGLTRLAQNETLVNVESLDLMISDPEIDGVAGLAASPFLGSLRHLTIDDNVARDVAIEVLARSPAPLERLALYCPSVETATVVAILAAKRLEHLVLRRPSNDRGALARAIAREPSSASLRSLQLGAASIGDDGADALATSPYLAKLRRLHLANNAIHDGTSIARAFPELVDLDLSSNYIAKPAVDHVLERPLVALGLKSAHHIFVVSRDRPPRELLTEVLREQKLATDYDALTTVSVRDYALGNTLVYFVLENEGSVEFENLRGIARIAGDPALLKARGLIRIDVQWDTNEPRVREIAKIFAARTGGIAYDTRHHEVL